MGSTSQNDRLLERDLLDVGNRLLNEPPSSIDELMSLLEEAERSLAKVFQKPSESMGNAMFPIMKALMVDELLKHSDLNIQVAVAACFNEIQRITSPTDPYNDEEMKEFFKLVIIALGQLSSDFSSKNYLRAREILDTVAQVTTANLMMDLEADVVEMFRVFLNTIRSDHPPDVFEYMEMIMTLVVEESWEESREKSDKIAFELLGPLLDSVKIANKNASPTAYELAKKVLGNCSTRLRRYVEKTVKTENLELEDYDEIVTSLCRGTMAPNGPSVYIELSESEQEDGASQINDGNQKIVQSETDTVHGKRGKKPNSRLRPDELYEHPWMRGQNSCEELSESGKAISPSDSSQIELDSSVNKLSFCRSGPSNSKKKVSMIPEAKDDGDEMADSPMSKRENSNQPMTEKKKKSRRSYGENLVNRRIMVWWPMDETFYTGSVIAFHPETKQHTILYDDDETEILNLRKERWELFDDNRPPVTKPVQRQEAEHPSPAKELVKIHEKTLKRKTVLSEKQR